MSDNKSVSSIQIYISKRNIYIIKVGRNVIDYNCLFRGSVSKGILLLFLFFLSFFFIVDNMTFG